MCLLKYHHVRTETKTCSKNSIKSRLHNCLYKQKRDEDAREGKATCIPFLSPSQTPEYLTRFKHRDVCTEIKDTLKKKFACSQDLHIKKTKKINTIIYSFFLSLFVTVFCRWNICILSIISVLKFTLIIFEPPEPVTFEYCWVRNSITNITLRSPGYLIGH